ADSSRPIAGGTSQPSAQLAPAAIISIIDRHQKGDPMNTAILLYDRFTALDAIGPYEVLSRLPSASVTFVAVDAGPVCTDNGMLTVTAERSLAEVPAPELVLVPGGPGEVAARAG